VRIVFLDRQTVRASFRRPDCEHEWQAHDFTAAQERIERARGAHALITNKVVLDEATLAQLPELRLIAVAATGVNNIDLPACASRDITVCNVRGYAADAVAEHTIASLLALRRNLFALRSDVAAGAWSRSKSFCLLDHPIRDLRGSTLGIVGYGAIGRRTAELAAAMGMRVRIAERRGQPPRPGRTSFDALLAEADALSLHCPLDDTNLHLIDADALKRMRPHAVIVNTARGGLIDPLALLDAIDAGTIAGAAIDVLEDEPPPSDHPLLRSSRPNLLVTPHVAWASDQAMQTLADQVIDNIEAYAAGRPQNVVSAPKSTQTGPEQV